LLKKNKALGWTFVSEGEAIQGVKHGDYYASIIIPNDFSEKMTTILTDDPQKPVLYYYVNEKINAVAPKITGKGASGIVETTSKNFIETSARTIFTIFNELGIELERNLPSIERIKGLIFRLEGSFPEIRRMINTALTDAQKAQNIVGRARQRLPIVADVTKTGGEFAASFISFLAAADEALTNASPAIQQDITLLQQIASSTANMTGLILTDGMDADQAKQAVQNMMNRLSAGVRIIDSMISFFDQLNKLSHSQLFSNTIQTLTKAKGNFQQQINLAKQASTALSNGQQPAAAILDRLNQRSVRTASLFGDVLSRYDTEIVPDIEQAFEKAKRTGRKSSLLLNEAYNSLPDVTTILTDASKGLVRGERELTAIKNDLPGLEKKINKLADDIREIESKEDLRDIINFLKNDVERQSDFFKEPVVLKQISLYHIPNYGSAISPFFTTLSLWVGALLLSSLLSVNVIDKEKAYNDHQIYFGRFLAFATIGIGQALILALGDLFLLKIYVVDKPWFVLFSLLNSIVFILIVYTLVSVFGNVGKALGVILLVLQISASGGTFPVQVTPKFFQVINPFLPFTYAISLLRESVGGILWDIVQKDVFILAGFGFLTVMMALFLKKPFSGLTEKFVEKAKESKLIH
jgi:putative membrane protein